MSNNLLPYQKRPQIYIYSSRNQPGLKIGYTERVLKSGKDFDAVEARIKEGLVKTPIKQYHIEWYESAVTKSNKYFTDKFVHKWLDKFKYKCLGGEWYDVSLEQAKAVIKAIKEERPEAGNDSRKDFPMRPEQKRAVKKTSEYFKKYLDESKPPRFLWNAKMRFGKTFTSYQLAKYMGWTRILVLTYKPGVEKEWRNDLYGHADFDGWQFIEGLSSWEENNIDESRPVVWFASYQDVMGTKTDGTLKERHRKMREIVWDSVFVDEYHFGAWRDAAKELGREEKSEKNMDDDLNEASEIEESLPLKARSYLYLSGTPFRALATGEFSEDQIFDWTYADEQREKKNWHGPEENPYATLPQIVMLTYQMPESLREIAMQGEFNEFDLNKFFSAHKDETGKWVFQREDYVQKFLNILHGIDLDVAVENKFDYHAPVLPYEDARLLSSLRHTFWFLPNVAACRAMERLLNNDPFYSGRYNIIRAAGNDTPGGKDAKSPVDDKIGDGFGKKGSITLSCGKLTTGVTVPAWSGVLFLRNSETPETYFQAAFRAQSPWVIRDANDPKKQNVIKPICYVLDFAPSRALRLISNYSLSLSMASDARRPEQKLEEFTEFLPVLCFDGVSMQRLRATEILDISTYGTASTMLARRWQQSKLIDTTSVVLEKVLNNKEIMDALENMEQFRGLRDDLTKIISREKAVHAAKKQRAEENREPTMEETAEEKAEKKERQDFKKELRKKLLIFIARIPVFMYLTDYREEMLIDVIRNLEPELFMKVTGLTIHEFDLMCEVGVFNQTELNDNIMQFRRFEDASLEYVGGRSAYEGGKVGLFDTTITREEMQEIIEAEL